MAVPHADGLGDDGAGHQDHGSILSMKEPKVRIPAPPLGLIPALALTVVGALIMRLLLMGWVF
jgi:hypothetical protein